MGYAEFSWEEYFSRPSVALRARNGSLGRGHVEAQDCSWGKLNLVSDFLKSIVVRAVPFPPPQSKRSRAASEL
jgi:hypothetical protein